MHVPKELTAAVIRNANLISVASCGKDTRERASAARPLCPCFDFLKSLKFFSLPLAQSLSSSLYFSPGEVVIMLATHTQASLC